MPAHIPGPLEAFMDALEDLEKTIHPTLHVYRWWRPDMRLPAIWNWMTPGDVERPDNCRVRDVLRITASIGVNPRAVAGQGDMREVEAYLDLALPKFDAELYGQRRPFGVHNARRRGSQTVTDRLGDAVILALEIPLEVQLDRPVGDHQ